MLDTAIVSFVGTKKSFKSLLCFRYQVKTGPFKRNWSLCLYCKCNAMRRRIHTWVPATIHNGSRYSILPLEAVVSLSAESGLWFLQPQTSA